MTQWTDLVASAPAREAQLDVLSQQFGLPPVRDPIVLPEGDRTARMKAMAPGTNVPMISTETSPAQRRRVKMGEALSGVAVSNDFERASDSVYPDGGAGAFYSDITNAMADLDVEDRGVLGRLAATERRFNTEAARAQVRDALANDTSVDPGDLSGLRAISYGQSQLKGVAAGRYQGRNAAIEMAAGNVGNSLGTLVHEIGHHVSTKGGGWEKRNAVLADGPTGRPALPAEEAFADDYAINMAPAARTHTYWDSIADETPTNADFRAKYRDNRMAGSRLSPNLPDVTPSDLLDARQFDEEGRYGNPITEAGPTRTDGIMAIAMRPRSPKLF